MSKAKRIGTLAETSVVNYLKSLGIKDVRRVVLHGVNDFGDIHVGSSDFPQIIFEVKSRKKEATYNEVEKFINELDKECVNVWGEEYKTNDDISSFVVLKRPGKGKVADWWLIWNQDNIIVRCRLGDYICERNVENGIFRGRTT